MTNLSKVFWGLALVAGAARADIVRIAGQVSGFPEMRRDNVVDGAVVVQSLRAQEVIRFQIENLMSPIEQMVAGPLKVDVPGNFFFPRQSESYGIIPVVIKKEEFTFSTPRELSQEVTTLSFQVPFKKMAELSQNHAPITELMKYVTFKNFGFIANRSYNGVKNISTKADRNFSRDVNYRWSRSPLGANATDMIVNFQQTPAKRWMFTDLMTNPAASGKIASVPNFARSFKTLFLRAFNDSHGQVRSALGMIRATSDNEGYDVSGLPDAFTGAALQNNRKVVWNAFCQSGYMAVILSPKPPAGSTIPVEPAISQVWVPGCDGHYEFSRPVAANEQVTLIFVGTDRPVDLPRDGEETPDLFTYATELRMLLL